MNTNIDKNIKIQVYNSQNPNFILRTERNQMGKIYDKMVRLAARLTEECAFEIVPHMNQIKMDIEMGKQTPYLFEFHDLGVNRYTLDQTEKACTNIGNIQFWKLTYDSDDMVSFYRVSVWEE